MRRVSALDRAKTRETFERRFAIERVAYEYTRIYRDLPGLRTSPWRFRNTTAAALGLVPASDRGEGPIMRKFGGRNMSSPLRIVGPTRAPPKELERDAIRWKRPVIGATLFAWLRLSE